MSASAQPFPYGHAQSPDWGKAAELCLQQMGYIPPEANLGFLYVTDVFSELLPEILAHLREETGIRHWTGSVGMGVCATGKEYYETGAIAAMAASLPEDSFRMLPLQAEGPLAGLALLDGLGGWLDEAGQYVGVVHGDPGNGDLPQMLTALAERLPGGYLVGGLSSARGSERQIVDEVVEGGLSGVVVDAARVGLVSGLSQGCTPIAGVHRITECERNIIAGIDDRPALDVFFEDIGEILARDLKRAAGYIFAALPLPGAESGSGGADYLVRNLVGVDTRNKLLAIGDLPRPGQDIMFCRRDGASAWQDLGRMLDDVAGRLPGPPRGGLYFSCLGRGQNLFGADSEELREIRSRLGDFPLVGFYANGEISRDRLYGYTGVLTLFT